jgi:DNA end-binding protein Ku
MTARAIWQGTLNIEKHRLTVKLYAAVLDRQIHFHLLHKRDRTRVEQRMVDAGTQRPVRLEETRRVFEAEPGVFVSVTPAEIERSVPEPTREVKISQCVPIQAIEPQLFDRPYYLGPDPDSVTDYFALAEALRTKKTAGIASWVMRKHSYVGALICEQGYLVLNTLRHAEEVIPVSQLEAPPGQPLELKEKKLAEQLIGALSGRFEPDAFGDEYQGRVRALIEAKRTGRKLRVKQVRKRRQEGSLTDSLRASLKGMSARRST